MAKQGRDLVCRYKLLASSSNEQLDVLGTIV